MKQEYAAPMNAKHFDGLPPTYIEVCEFDPLRAEGKRYAQNLREAGVKIDEYFVEGAPHAYDLRISGKHAQKFISKRVEAFKEAFNSVEK